MPSPFPGMDPWLESSDIWPDLHRTLASEMSSVLNQTLPAGYYARLQTRPEAEAFDVVEDISDADVSVVPAAWIVEPHSAASRFLDEGKHASVQIFDSRRGHRLVTFIEIVSPSNKISGADRQAFIDKHQELYGSEASIIELDLLRGGNRILHDGSVANVVAEMRPPADYIVLVNRAWRRDEPTYQIFPIPLRDMLPCILVPLREGEDEVPLDLQYVFNRAYDSGPYRRGAVDYGRPPHPPLSGEDVEWARQRLREAAMIG